HTMAFFLWLSSILMPWSRTPNPPQCRPMVEADWELVRAIYLEGIATGQATFETTAPADWETWSAGKLGVGRSVAAAAEDATQLLGWTSLAPVSTRQVYAGVAELTIYVAAVA